MALGVVLLREVVPRLLQQIDGSSNGMAEGPQELRIGGIAPIVAGGTVTRAA
jgi:hypothetical protein